MSIRIVETRPGDVIVNVNRNHLLKFIGWCEAHRRPGEWEPSWLANCLTDLNVAREGDDLAATVTVTCAGCGAEYDFGSPDVLRDWDAGGWFCSNDDECNGCRMGADLAEEPQS